MSQDLTVKIGKPAAWSVVIKRDGALVSLAGARLWFTVKRTPGAPDAEATFQLTNDDADGLVVQDDIACTVDVTISAERTALLNELVAEYWDLVVQYADGWVGVGDELGGRISASYPATASPTP